MYFKLVTIIPAFLALMAPVTLPQPQPQAPPPIPTSLNPTPVPDSPTILPGSPFSKEEVEAEVETNRNQNQNQPRQIDYTFDISFLNDTMSEPGTSTSTTDGHLQKRHTVVCRWDERQGADLIPITEGIEFLRKRKGRPDLDPNKCTVVSCSYNSAIYWCNVGPKKFYLPSYNNIADSAQVIKNQCHNGSVRRQFGGEVHHPDHWYAGIDGYRFQC